LRVESLHQAIHAEPFRPFVICLANGSRIDVPHPEWILHPPEARTAIVMGPDDSFRVVDIALVLELQVSAPIPPGPTGTDPNGQEGT
jgi:hypothetical protein